MQLAMQASVDERVESARSQTERVITYDRLTALPGKYDAFFSENGVDSFFLSLPWFRNFCANALDPGDELRIFVAEQTGPGCRPVAGLLTRSQRESIWHLAPRTLHSLSNFYTSLYAPLLSQSIASPTAVASLVRAISIDKPGWDAVDLKWLDSGAPVFGELQQAFRAVGMVVQTYFSSGNWYLPANGMSFREYWEGLRSSVRNIAKSKNKKIERSGRAKLEIVTGPSGLESAIEAYEHVYASSWKTAEPYPAFIPGLIRTCAEQGWLRLGVVRVDGEPAAVQLWIVNSGKAAIYKIAYDRRFADLSVGSFLTTHMMEHVLDVDRVREVDYLTGDDKYKQDWMSHRRERWGILAMNPRTLRGAMAIARHVGGRTVKRALQAIPARKQKSSNQLGPTGKRVDSGK